MKFLKKHTVPLAGLLLGVLAALAVLWGNPKNMGVCIACFLRDTAGALGLHSATAVQYVRPEIIGIVLGACGAALLTGEFKSRGGSSPFTRFALGAFAMVGCLMFLGCPLRMTLRLAGGDLTALSGLIGFVFGIGSGCFFLNRGFSLGRSHAQTAIEGAIFPLTQVLVLTLLLFTPALLHFTAAGEGPGGSRAAIAVSLGCGLVAGAVAQRTRLCFAGGLRDTILFRDTHLLKGFIAVFLGALATNLLLTAVTSENYFTLSFENQPVAHTDAVWNGLGMLLTGLCAVLLGGCPLRQLVLAGEGSGDSAFAVLGLVAGAALCHNWGLASSAAGPTENGKIAVVLCLAATVAIAAVNTFRKKK